VEVSLVSELKFTLETVEIPEDCNVIVGQSHFIKTVEDLFEA
jgi:adenosine/AMP kinase